MSTSAGEVEHASPAAREAADRHVEAQRESFLAEHQALIEAVYAIAAVDDDLSPTVAQIVERSGLSNQAFYAHFSSKDELLLAVMADGRHRLVGYLSHRMDGTEDPTERVREWVRGVMAQAADPEAARRSRPFAVHADRLAAEHPDENRRSVELLSAQFAGAVAAVASAEPPADRTVELALWTCLAEMQRLLRARIRPSDADIEATVTFIVNGLDLI